MTVSDLAAALGISRETYYQRRKDPAAPKELDVDAWRAYLGRSRVHTPPERRADPNAGQKNPDAEEISYVYERARKTKYAADALQIELEATRRSTVRKEEVQTLFSQIAAVVRGRLLKLRADLPCALAGRTEAEIERIVTDRIEHALSGLSVPETFFAPKGLV